jgi:hypothetical protein
MAMGGYSRAANFEGVLEGGGEWDGTFATEFAIEVF